jgi:D-sedoheptulose 7-phosphate isomerase
MTSPAELAHALASCFERRRKVLACGNGGSAAQGQHFVAELVGRYKRERLPMPAISLCADVAVLTAIANDYGYDEVFARQVTALGERGDVLLCLSTSGKSRNLIRAAEAAIDLNMQVVSIVGREGSPLETLSHLTLVTPGDTAEAQEQHLRVCHTLAGELEALWTS